MFHTILIANRGEIACRITRTLKRLGIASIAIHAADDQNSEHVRAADRAVLLPGNTLAHTYLNIEAIVAAACEAGAQAIIPGYGFLSENAAFARACEAAGLVFIGPSVAQLEQFGLKHTARALAEQAGVPVLPGSAILHNVEGACAAAARIGYPIMLKSTAGGGGMGMMRCDDETQLVGAFESVEERARTLFANAGVFIEKLIVDARHIEVQIFGDGMGEVLTLGERDCSLQRRNQKVIEETPAPGLPLQTRERMLIAARDLGRLVRYRSTGTVEFIYDQRDDAFYFLEVNARLQVEHAITEAVTGIDLIEWMLLTAAGRSPVHSPAPISPHRETNAEPSPTPSRHWQIPCRGVSIEARLYAEDPLQQFAPSPGQLTEVCFPVDTSALLPALAENTNHHDGQTAPRLRIDSGITVGAVISPQYDPLLAKLIVWAEDRAAAVAAMQNALANTRLSGIATNLDFLRDVMASPDYLRGEVNTATLGIFLRESYHPARIEVMDGGTYTTIQDYPGRVAYWHVGIPPSGPMDDWAFRLGNCIVGNAPDAAGMETTMLGPKLRFHVDSVIALTGAPTHATLDNDTAPLPFWQAISVRRGQVLNVGRALNGCRSYLAVQGGVDVPLYLNSRATFALAQMGGHAGRALRRHDSIAISRDATPGGSYRNTHGKPRIMPQSVIPSYGSSWTIGVLAGPHGAPDFFREAWMQTFFDTDWEVHYNSNRLGIRLIGPTPEWARTDGGEAGLHPSNIHDCVYAVGSINFTGDMPVILTHDGPSLGGFVCPVTIARAQLWKVGQLRPGDRIRFHLLSADAALALEREQDRVLEDMRRGEQIDDLASDTVAQHNPKQHALLERTAPTSRDAALQAVVFATPASHARPAMTIRQAGDKALLVEYGENVLDLNLRFRIHALMGALQPAASAESLDSPGAASLTGIKELAPGVRSLQIQYDSRVLAQSALVSQLIALDESLGTLDDFSVPSRILHLPLAYEDSTTHAAVDRYRQSVRDTAPWLPSNTEFIQRINGLSDPDDVRNTIFAASYLVLGLGDVYLGAPCAVAVDPRHRLLTSKYNPARTHTAEGAVGLGGIYMCIYGMESPGGYQLVGRTLPIWNPYLKNTDFAPGQPWLLRLFDQIRYYPVSEDELTTLRRNFHEGRWHIRIEETRFNLAEHHAFLKTIQTETTAFQARQQTAFVQEVSRWENKAQLDSGVFSSIPAVNHATTTEDALSEHDRILADITGNVWKIFARPGDTIQAGDALMIIEAMKMEFTVCAPRDGVVRAVHCSLASTVHAGEVLMSLNAAPINASGTESGNESGTTSGNA